MKRAFTLIELLVVIAIIAILAAILFPVFAQAKEAAKKTTAISNAKQMGTGAVLYSADQDDMFPFSIPPNTAAGTWRNASILDVPARWRAGITGSGYPDREMLYANSIQPYIKNYQLYEAQGGNNVSVSGVSLTSTTGIQPANVSFVMNGFLGAWSGTAINSPSFTPLFWNGFGKVTMQGFTLANPQPNCPTGIASACTFNPALGYAWFYTGGAPWTNATRPTAWYYGRGMIFVRSDTSAKFRSIAGARDGVTWNNSNANPAADPFNRYDATAAPLSMLGCDPAGGTQFMGCFFRPDLERNN